MNLVHEAAMLAPLAVIAAINLALYLGGERGTLLLPVPMDFPPVPLAPAAAAAPAQCAAGPRFEDELRLAA